jgi:aspartyl protease family protein
VIRGYLATIVVLGVVSSLLGGMMSPAPSGSGPKPKTHVVEPRDGAAADDGADYRSSQTEHESDGSVRLERETDGHFYADVRINGATVHTLVDTGATGIALSREDARKAGLPTSIGMPDVVGQGADGEVRGEFVTLDTVSLGGKSVKGLDAVVLNRGEQSLLGQTFLSEFETVEIRGDTMVLR